jgi:hypothetical protein
MQSNSWHEPRGELPRQLFRSKNLSHSTPQLLISSKGAIGAAGLSRSLNFSPDIPPDSCACQLLLAWHHHGFAELPELSTHSKQLAVELHPDITTLHEPCAYHPEVSHFLRSAQWLTRAQGEQINVLDTARKLLIPLDGSFLLSMFPFSVPLRTDAVCPALLQCRLIGANASSQLRRR